jgi:hypothetical protein
MLCRHFFRLDCFICSFLWLLIGVQLASGQIFINEFCASNTATITDEEGDYEDWIELYNAGAEAVSLQGYYLTDDLSQPYQFSLPEVWVNPGGFAIIWASGKDMHDGQGAVHTNFSLASSGEPIGLHHAEGGLIDAVPAAALGSNISYGRQADGSAAFFFFESPTPLASNNDAITAEAYLSPPEMLTPSGFYSSPFDLFLFHPDPEATIHYTLDGSEPTAGSPEYTSALPIENMLGTPDVLSAIPTTSLSAPEWYRWFAPMTPVYKGTSLRAKAFRAGAIASSVATATYIVDPDWESRYDLPVVALTLPQSSLLGSQGIYTNFLASGPSWERLAHLELFEADGSSILSTDVGLRLHGGNSKRFALKSLRVYFRGSLGEEALDYPIFQQGSMHRHERLLLRNSGSDWSRTYFRDAFAQQLLLNYSDVDYMRYRPAVTFVNGEYWGILNLRERFDNNYIRNHFGLGSDEIDMLEFTSTTVYGSNAEYLGLRNTWQNEDLTIAENYAEVEAQVDIDNFRDYHILQVYIMNTDQPGKNVRFWKPKAEGGKWRWMLFDLDDALSYGPHCSHDRNGLVFCSGLNSISANVVNPTSASPAWAVNGPSQTLPLRAMLRSPFFRNNFIHRFSDLLNTAFMPDRLQEMIDAFDGNVAPYMQEHFERWHRPEPTFRATHLDLLHTFATNRKAVMEAHLIDFLNWKAATNSLRT